jgi:hypothetical protein
MAAAASPRSSALEDSARVLAYIQGLRTARTDSGCGAGVCAASAPPPPPPPAPHTARQVPNFLAATAVQPKAPLQGRRRRAARPPPAHAPSGATWHRSQQGIDAAQRSLASPREPGSAHLVHAPARRALTPECPHACDEGIATAFSPAPCAGIRSLPNALQPDFRQLAYAQLVQTGARAGAAGAAIPQVHLA